MTGNLDLFFLTDTYHYKGFDRTEDMATNYTAGTFPAAESAYNYTELPVPLFSTGWFMPSAGQWKKIVAGLSDFKNLNQSHTWSQSENEDYTGPYLAAQVDAKLSVAGSYDGMYINTDGKKCYATSSEYGPSHAAILNWHTLGIILNGMYRYSNTFVVRPVFAF